jgi:hypothetical protein
MTRITAFFYYRQIEELCCHKHCSVVHEVFHSGATDHHRQPEVSGVMLELSQEEFMHLEGHLERDGFGALSRGTVTGCDQPAGCVSATGDCDDSSYSVHPHDLDQYLAIEP